MRVALLGGELAGTASGPDRAAPDPSHRPHPARHVRRTPRSRHDGSLLTEQATLFQLDEYLGLGATDERSYRAYLARELRGLRFRAFHELDGTAVDQSERARHQRSSIRRRSASWSWAWPRRTRRVRFTGSSVAAGARGSTPRNHTRRRRRRLRRSREGPPRSADGGLRTLAEARELLMLVVSGPAKAAALREMFEGEQSPACPASLLRDHPRLTVICDTAAAGAAARSEELVE